MTQRKQALLIFTKPPIPGVVKTRMTTEYGGFLTKEQAVQFYKCCFYDICEMSMQALKELQDMNDAAVAADPDADVITYDFFCSTTPAKSLGAVHTGRVGAAVAEVRQSGERAVVRGEPTAAVHGAQGAQGQAEGRDAGGCRG